MVWRPTRRISPVGITTSRPSTYSRVTPYLSARGPPAFSATLPPMAQRSSEFGIGRVEEAVLLHLRLEHAGDHPRLHPRGEVGGTDVEDAVHPLHRHPDPAVDGERAARLPAARADGHDRDPVAGRDGEDGPHLLRRLDLHHDAGREIAHPRLVLAVRREPVLVEDQPRLREGGAQLGDGLRHPLPPLTRTPPRRCRSSRPAPPPRTSPPPARPPPAPWPAGTGSAPACAWRPRRARP